MKSIEFKQCSAANYRAGRTKPVEYIVIHYTAGNGDTAKNNVLYYASANAGASAHYFVDEKEIWQSVRDSDTAWAVGGTSSYKHPDCRNSNSISVELCSRNRNGSGKSAADNGWYFKPETVENAAELTKELMKKYGVPPEKVLRHYDVWDKICPAPFVNDPAQWDDFKERLEEEMTAEEKAKIKELSDKVSELQKHNKVYRYFDELPDYARSIIKELYDKGFYKGAGPADLDLPENLMRTLVIVYRLLYPSE